MFARLRADVHANKGKWLLAGFLSFSWTWFLLTTQLNVATLILTLPAALPFWLFNLEASEGWRAVLADIWFPLALWVFYLLVARYWLVVMFTQPAPSARQQDSADFPGTTRLDK